MSESGFAGMVVDDLDGACWIDAGVDGGVEVALFVADHPRAGEVEVEFGGGGLDHAGAGFAPGVLVLEAGVGGAGVVGGGVAGVDQGVGDGVGGAVGGRERQLGAEGVVAGVDVADGAAGAGDTALVGDDDDGEAGGAEACEGVGHAGQGVDMGRVEQVAGGAGSPGGGGEVGVAAEGVVAVEEDGGAGWGCGHGGG